MIISNSTNCKIANVTLHRSILKHKTGITIFLNHIQYEKNTSVSQYCPYIARILPITNLISSVHGNHSNKQNSNMADIIKCAYFSTLLTCNAIQSTMDRPYNYAMKCMQVVSSARLH